ncbi:phage tail protein [Prosthecomicrobium pneumaticum]|uniref:Microcystin-dependent protein n=1 Tax=Prosthecomicrobium pneumaticum TaxID=81895 RepID=A0A7W9L1P8_9HYPH|nr:tail fiber protein [Prosthecomicrobium pneumaticum]MBB5752873.1 microcystin-dependent protein [Prosthecomicrobium pneumaticum]
MVTEPTKSTDREAEIVSLIGHVALMAVSEPPKNWIPCDGRTLLREANEILFSVIGTTYGGDGERTFLVPDLRAAVPIHDSTHYGQGVKSARLEQPVIALTEKNLPPHTHAARFTGKDSEATGSVALTVVDKSGQAAPEKDGFLGKGGSGTDGAQIYVTPADAKDAASVTLSGGAAQIKLPGNVTTDPTGYPDVQLKVPAVGMMWCICAAGLYPEF